jgi:hypothetical protein
MMKRIAFVREVTGNAKHSFLSSDERGAPRGTQFAPAARLEIEPNGGESSSFFLIRYDSSGGFAGDTWHKTLEEAKSQAEWEFKIPPDAWTEVTVPDDDLQDHAA